MMLSLCHYVNSYSPEGATNRSTFYLHYSSFTFSYFYIETVHSFYRAMHFSAKRGIAIACRLSVCPSVCDVGEL